VQPCLPCLAYHDHDPCSKKKKKNASFLFRDDVSLLPFTMRRLRLFNERVDYSFQLVPVFLT
jgi:hypothetical protein